MNSQPLDVFGQPGVLPTEDKLTDIKN
jgi:hypothetical protein